MKTNSNITLPMMARWWKSKTLHYQKGGSFNVQLYLRICEIKNATK